MWDYFLRQAVFRILVRVNLDNLEALKNAASSRADLKALCAELLDNVDNLVEVNFVEAVAV